MAMVSRLVLIDDLPDWTGARCVEVDPALFFPRETKASGYTAREAKKICAECDIRIKCLEFALDQNIHFGVWGGATTLERRAMRKLFKK